MAPSKAQRTVAAERTAQAIRLRIAGMDWEGIAKQVGYARASSACTAVTRAMERAVAQEAAAVEVYKKLQVDRQNRLLAGLWAQATGGAKDPTDEKGERRLLADPQAAEVCRKIVSDQIKLLVGNAPKQLEVLSLDAIDLQIRALQAQMAEGG